MKRFVILELTAVLTVGIIAGALTFTAPHASAADRSVRGPSAGADKCGNQYVVWEDSQTNLVTESSGAIEVLPR